MKTREEQRMMLAGMAMQGILANPYWNEHGDFTSNGIAESAQIYADALLAELDRTAPKPETPSPDADGWIEHRPGDPMPCDGGMMVLVKLRNGNTWDVPDRADWWADDSEMSDCWRSENSSSAIIAWKPA